MCRQLDTWNCSLLRSQLNERCSDAARRGNRKGQHVLCAGTCLVCTVGWDLDVMLCSATGKGHGRPGLEKLSRQERFPGTRGALIGSALTRACSTILCLCSVGLGFRVLVGFVTAPHPPGGSTMLNYLRPLFPGSTQSAASLPGAEALVRPLPAPQPGDLKPLPFLPVVLTGLF